jgi:hypothetical protein
VHQVAHGFDFLSSSHDLSRPASIVSDVSPGEQFALIGAPLAFDPAGCAVDVAAPHDDPAVLLARLVSFGLLVDRGVLRE